MLKSSALRTLIDRNEDIIIERAGGNLAVSVGGYVVVYAPEEAMWEAIRMLPCPLPQGDGAWRLFRRNITLADYYSGLNSIMKFTVEILAQPTEVATDTALISHHAMGKIKSARILRTATRHLYVNARFWQYLEGGEIKAVKWDTPSPLISVHDPYTIVVLPLMGGVTENEWLKPIEGV